MPSYQPRSVLDPMNHWQWQLHVHCICKITEQTTKDTFSGQSGSNCLGVAAAYPNSSAIHPAQYSRRGALCQQLSEIDGKTRQMRQSSHADGIVLYLQCECGRSEAYEWWRIYFGSKWGKKATEWLECLCHWKAIITRTWSLDEVYPKQMDRFKMQILSNHTKYRMIVSNAIQLYQIDMSIEHVWRFMVHWRHQCATFCFTVAQLANCGVNLHSAWQLAPCCSTFSNRISSSGQFGWHHIYCIKPVLDIT